MSSRALLILGAALLGACPQPSATADGGTAATDAGAPDGDGGSIADGGSADGGTSFVRLRLLTGNITSGNAQSYDPGEGLRIFRGLSPDVALIQEFNYGDGSDEALRGMIDTAFGPDFGYVRGAAGQQIPNGIASRFPIVDSGEWADPEVGNRDFVWARIALPGGEELFAVSVHLLTSSAAERDAEARALVTDLRDEVPEGDLVVLGGDFNTSTRDEACIATLGVVFATGGPYPADQEGNGNTSGNRTKPHDWLLVDPVLDDDEAPLELGANAFPDGLVFDSRDYTPLADVAPVEATDSGAANMQHMAVARDFVISN